MKILILSILIAVVIAATYLIISLYQGPGDNGQVWTPTLEAITGNSSLTIKVIINPSNDPGNGISDPQYVAGTKSLAPNSNVQLLGYVRASPGLGKTRCGRPTPTWKPKSAPTQPGCQPESRYRVSLSTKRPLILRTTSLH